MGRRIRHSRPSLQSTWRRTFCHLWWSSMRNVDIETWIVHGEVKKCNNLRSTRGVLTSAWLGLVGGRRSSKFAFFRSGFNFGQPTSLSSLPSWTPQIICLSSYQISGYYSSRTCKHSRVLGLRPRHVWRTERQLVFLLVVSQAEMVHWMGLKLICIGVRTVDPFTLFQVLVVVATVF